jgi:hypothetical protein
MKILLIILFCYQSLFAQGAQVEQMHTVLENLYKEMMPMCKDMVRVGQVIACFGALILYRVSGMEKYGKCRTG